MVVKVLAGTRRKIDTLSCPAILGLMRKQLLAGALVGAALLLTAACGEDAPAGPGGTSTTGPGSGDGNPNHDACLVGTWQLDVQDAADQLVALMSIPGATAEASGTVTLAFADTLTSTWDETLKLTLPLGSQDMVATAVYSGSTVLSEWTANEGVLRASGPSGDFHIDLTYAVGGVEVPVPGGITPPNMGDLSGGEVAYTCSGDSATLSPPAPAPTWRMSRA
jgi:hypothetical protein